MLIYLIDTEDFVTQRLEDDTSYFMCTNEFILKCQPGWAIYTIPTAVKNLIEKSLIDVKMVTIKGLKHRFIKLNYENVDKLKHEYKLKCKT